MNLDRIRNFIGDDGSLLNQGMMSPMTSTQNDVGWKFALEYLTCHENRMEWNTYVTLPPEELERKTNEGRKRHKVGYTVHLVKKASYRQEPTWHPSQIVSRSQSDGPNGST